MRPDARATPPQDVRKSQIIKLALFMGVATFSGVAILQTLNRQGPAGQPLMTYLMAGFGVTAVVLRLVVPSLLVKTQLRQLAREPGEPDESRCAALYMNQLVVGSALLEGGAFANLIALMLVGNWISLAIGGGLAVGILVDFPTLGRWEQWLETQRVWLRDERKMTRLGD